MRTNCGRLDYSKDIWTYKELVFTVSRCLLVTLLLSYFFYRSIWGALPLSIVGIGYFRMRSKKRRAARKEDLEMQFMECILSVSASLKAGYAIENAFVESREDMRQLFGEKSLICAELDCIRRGLVINISLEELLADFAERSDCFEICRFARIFSVAKRSGGDLTQVISSSADMISHRLNIKQEALVSLSGRRLEQNIMKLIPFCILEYIGITYPGYFDVLYHNLKGIALMTACLLAYLAACVLGDRILQRIKEGG